MKKILSLFAAVFFVGSMIAEDFHLVQVTSVEKNKTYAFARNGKALTKTATGSLLQTADVSLGTLDGSEAYYWKLVEATGGFKLEKTEGKYLKNGSSTSLSTSENEGNNIWTFIFASDGKAKIKNIETERYLMEVSDGSNTYKAYAEGDLESRGHDFIVYELVSGPSAVATIEAEKIDLKAAIVSALPFKKDTSLAISATNLSAEIAATVTGSNITIEGAPVAKDGGTLVVKINAAAEGEFSDTIVLSSGSIVTKVAVEANVVKPEGEGSEEKPFTLADVAKIKSGTGNLKFWVKGIIAGCAGSNGAIKPEADSTCIALGNSATQTEGLTAVKLGTTSNAEKEVRNALNVVGEQAANIGREVQVFGKLEVYKGTHGVTATSAYKWLGEAPKSNDASIKLLKINGAAISADNKVYAYTVAADANMAQVEVVYELNHAGATADKASGFKVDVPAASTDPATEVKLTVTAEDETTKVEYTIKVSRAAADAPKSNDATIKEVKINNIKIDEKNGEFAYEVAAGENLAEVEVAFILNDPHATADKDNPFKLAVPASSEAAATEATINVTAEDGTTKKAYTIKVTRAAAAAQKSNDATIKELKINNVKIDEKNGEFAYEVPAGENLAEVEVSFVLNDAKANADKTSPFKLAVPASSEAAATEATINVTAEDGTTKKAYTIKVTRAAAEQGIDEVLSGNEAIKRIENGQLVIIKHGVRYNATGAKL